MYSAYIFFRLFYSSFFASLVKALLINKKIVYYSTAAISFVSCLFVFNLLPVSMMNLVERAFSLFYVIFDPMSDSSRSGIFSDLSNFFDPAFWLYGKSDLTGAADNGLLNILYNYGLLVFVFIFIFAFYLYRLFPLSYKPFLAAIILQFVVASETLFIPRYCLLVFASFVYYSYCTRYHLTH